MEASLQNRRAAPPVQTYIDTLTQAWNPASESFTPTVAGYVQGEIMHHPYDTCAIGLTTRSELPHVDPRGPHSVAHFEQHAPWHRHELEKPLSVASKMLRSLTLHLQPDKGFKLNYAVDAILTSIEPTTAFSRQYAKYAILFTRRSNTHDLAEAGTLGISSHSEQFDQIRGENSAIKGQSKTWNTAHAHDDNTVQTTYLQEILISADTEPGRTCFSHRMGGSLLAASSAHDRTGRPKRSYSLLLNGAQQPIHRSHRNDSIREFDKRYTNEHSEERFLATLSAALPLIETLSLNRCTNANLHFWTNGMEVDITHGSETNPPHMWKLVIGDYGSASANTSSGH
ncbi:uncharacterized protein I303_100921 [Kwoniella dejecticola CBS 10117]|uniref:Uncharacterized protein n=1 Tax=Kwoniella dejecticola CBS 10117 TaxID=1296121 RepID=A0A1A6AGF0_9TREE|nr:uncharacterized protein I303_00925 [Kwoniella dejecticola CBS 10117]OBR89103.1 hypothetical protein I303_00925 [Kwoniella dejecticola CBS 10117]